jgi:hypothetical protein
MKKLILSHVKLSLLFSFMALSYQSYAGACNSIKWPCCLECRVSSEKFIKTVLYTDTGLLNLKPSAARAVAATNSAITITQADYQSITQNGNSWVDFRNLSPSFTMNIGSADNSNAQTFTLPTNLLTYFSNYSRLDFINETSLDASLRIEGATTAARRKLIDQDENIIYQYYHVDVATDGVYVLGTSYDMYDETDDNFDEEADYEFLDAPLSLNDVIITVREEQDYETNICTKWQFD